jgi:hypothetical protein
MDKKYVAPIEVLVGLGWLPLSVVDQWRQGRLQYLELGVSANLGRLTTSMKILRHWAASRGLQPSETAYVARTRNRRPLRFSASGREEIERAYRTHWLSPQLSERALERLTERQSRPPDLVVIQPLKDWTCTGCGGSGDLLIMEEPGPTCLACADMDHLVFLASGDATLTRRAKKGSRLSAVVVRFSRERRRYERQGILVEEEALARAEADCLADEEARARRRLRDEARRAHEDRDVEAGMAGMILAHFPRCGPERAREIARHAGARGSGRVGRSRAGRALDAEAISLAVIASVRHLETAYDELLMVGIPRAEARERVWPDVEQVLDAWRRRAPPP